MSRQLRFCMISTFYPPYNFGGDGVFVQQLSTELACRGHRVDVIHCVDSYKLASSLPSEGYRTHPNITVHGLKSRVGMLSPLATHQSGYPIFKGRRIQAILEQGFDVIHYHNVSLVGGPSVLQMGQAIKLYTLHDYWLVCPTHALFKFNREPCTRATDCFLCTLAYKRPPQLWRYSNLLNKSIESVDAFIAPSLTNQRKHEQMGLTGRIEHLPNFVSVMPDDKPGTNGRNGKLPMEPYFLFVGRLEKLKGLHTIIPVFHKYQRAQLWIAGTGSEEMSLRNSAMGDNNVRFLGFQSGSDLQDLYRGAVAVIYPAINFQSNPAQACNGNGAPLVIMEAYAQQTPVLVNNLGRVSAIIQQTGGGIVYSTEEELIAAMDCLLANPSHRQELGLRGYRAFQQNWTAEAYLQRYFALIEDIARTRNAENLVATH